MSGETPAVDRALADYHARRERRLSRREPAPAAPAAEPEMRAILGRMLCRADGLSEEEADKSWANLLTYSTERTAVDEAEAIIARHDAERDARIRELESERDEALREHTDMMWQRRRADDRARVAEAALAEERAVTSEMARAALDHSAINWDSHLRHIDRETRERFMTRAIEAALRSRAITAEGADTGEGAA